MNTENQTLPLNDQQPPFDTDETGLSTLEQPQAPAIPSLTIEQLIEQEKSKFTTTPEMIKGFKKKFGKLKITDVNDKKGYKEVTQALSIVRTARTQIAKDKDFIKDRYKQVGKALDEKQKELETMIKAVEEPLKQMKDDIDDAELREKTRLAEERATLERSRVQEIMKYCAFDGVFYSIGESTSIAATDVPTISPELYSQFMDKVRETYDAAELARIEKEKADKEAADKKLLEDEEQARIQTELKGAILKARHRIMLGSNYVLSGEKYMLLAKRLPDDDGSACGSVIHSVTSEEVSSMHEDNFYKMLDDAEEKVTKQYNDTVESLNRIQRTKERIAELESEGYKFSYSVEGWGAKTLSGQAWLFKAAVEQMEPQAYSETKKNFTVSYAELEEKELLRVQAEVAAANKLEQDKKDAAISALPEAERIEYVVGLLEDIYYPADLTGPLANHFNASIVLIKAEVEKLRKLVNRVKDAAGAEINGEGNSGKE